HQEPDAEDTREAALVFPVQLALDAFAFKHVLEDLRLDEVIGCVDHHWLVYVHSQDSLCKKRTTHACLSAKPVHGMCHIGPWYSARNGRISIGVHQRTLSGPEHRCAPRRVPRRPG